jgi:hypothetical protein
MRSIRAFESRTVYCWMSFRSTAGGVPWGVTAPPRSLRLGPIWRSGGVVLHQVIGVDDDHVNVRVPVHAVEERPHPVAVLLAEVLQQQGAVGLPGRGQSGVEEQAAEAAAVATGG